MKIEFESSIKRSVFLCHLLDIRIAWVNLCEWKTVFWISMSYGSRTSSCKPWRWMRLDLIFTMRDIYINFKLDPLTKCSSSRGTIFFSLIRNLSDDHEDCPNWRKNNHKSCKKRDIPFWVWKKSIETETTLWSEFENGGKPL